MPLDILTLVWTLHHLSNLNVILQIFNLIGFFSLFFYANVHFREKTFDEDIAETKTIYTKQFIKDYISGIIHFASYVCLICINCSFNLYGLYFLLAHFLLAIAFGMRIKIFNKSKFMYQYSSYIYQQLIHIVIDDQDSTYLGRFIESYQLTNIQYMYSLIMKLYLLLTLAIQYNEQIIKSNNDKLFIFSIILIIVSVISIVLLIYKILENSELARYFNSQYVYGNFDDFMLDSYNDDRWFSKLRINNKVFKNILIRDQAYQKKIFFASLLFFNFKNSQIICYNGSRKRIDIRQKQQCIELNFEISNDELLKEIGDQKLLPEIEKVVFSSTDIHLQTYKKLVENNMGVLFSSREDKQNISSMNQNLFYKVKQINAQYQAFDKIMSKSQIINPKILFYDLYEDFAQSNYMF